MLAVRGQAASRAGHFPGAPAPSCMAPSSPDAAVRAYVKTFDRC